MKPIVFYSGEPYFYEVAGVLRAEVFALNHPRLGQQSVKTSIVLSIQENSFETMNTVYKKNVWPFPSFPLVPTKEAYAPVKQKPFNPDEFEEALL